MVTLATFMLVSRDDIPQYECDFGSQGGQTTSGNPSGKKDDAAHLHQFVMHASLDFLDERCWETPSMNLKLVDRFNDLSVYGFCTAGGTRFLLLVKDNSSHLSESVKSFFHEVHEFYLRVQMNPFHTTQTPILDKTFDKRVKELGRRHFP